MDKFSIQNLVQAAQARDDRAFAVLINEHRTRVFGAVWSVLQDFDDAEDATQETFVLAYRHLVELRDPQKFSFWLYSIARNVARKTMRKRVLQFRGLLRFKEISDFSEQETTEAVYDIQTLNKAFEALSQGDRTVTTLFYLVGLDQEYIAKLLEIPIGTVKSRLHRSRTQLKRRLLTMAKETVDRREATEDYGRSVIGGTRGVIHWQKLLEKEGFEDFRMQKGVTEEAIENVWTRTNDAVIGDADPDSNSGSFLIIGDPSWQNYELSLLITPISGGNAQVFFRMSEDKNCWYLLDFLLGWQAVAISRVDSNGLTKLSVVNYPLELGQEYDVQIAARQASLTSYIDGKLVNQVTDFTYTSGAIALNVWQCKTAFRDLRFRLLH